MSSLESPCFDQSPKNEQPKKAPQPYLLLPPPPPERSDRPRHPLADRQRKADQKKAGDDMETCFNLIDPLGKMARQIPETPSLIRRIPPSVHQPLPGRVPDNNKDQIHFYPGIVSVGPDAQVGEITQK